MKDAVRRSMTSPLPRAESLPASCASADEPSTARATLRRGASAVHTRSRGALPRPGLVSDTLTPAAAGPFAVAPSGRLAAALMHGTLLVSEVDPGAAPDSARCFGRRAQQPRITRFAWLPDRAHPEALVCLDHAGRAYRVDPEAGRRVALAPEARFITMQVGHCSDRVALSTPEGAVQVVPARCGSATAVVPLPHSIRPRGIRALVWSQDDGLLAVGLDDQQALLFDVARRRVGAPFPFNDYAATLRFSHDARTVATVLPEGNAAWVDTASGLLRQALHGGAAGAVAWSPSDRLFAMALEGRVEVVATDGSAAVRFVSAQRKGAVKALDFADEGQLLLQRSDNTEELLSLAGPPKRVMARCGSGRMSASADGRFIAYVRATGEIIVSRSESPEQPLLCIARDERVAATAPQLSWASHAPVLLADYAGMLRHFPLENLPSPASSRTPSPEPWPPRSQPRP